MNDLAQILANAEERAKDPKNLRNLNIDIWKWEAEGEEVILAFTEFLPNHVIGDAETSTIAPKDMVKALIHGQGEHILTDAVFAMGITNEKYELNKPYKVTYKGMKQGKEHRYRDFRIEEIDMSDKKE